MAPACEPKGHGFDSQSVHMPGFGPGPQLGARERQLNIDILSFSFFLFSLSLQINKILKKQNKTALTPWLVWLSGLRPRLQTKSLLVRFPARAHAWVAGQGPIWRCVRGNLLMDLSHINVSLSLSKNKYFLKNCNDKLFCTHQPKVWHLHVLVHAMRKKTPFYPPPRTCLLLSERREGRGREGKQH